MVFVDNYNNNSNSAQFFMGYDSNNYFWHDSRIWGRIKNFTGSTNNKPGLFSRIRLHGAVFQGSCTGTRVPLDRTRQLKHESFKFRHDFDFDFRLRSDDDMFATFNVFGTSPTGPDLTFTKGFSTI